MIENGLFTYDLAFNLFQPIILGSRWFNQLVEGMQGGGIDFALYSVCCRQTCGFGYRKLTTSPVCLQTSSGHLLSCAGAFAYGIRLTFEPGLIWLRGSTPKFTQVSLSADSFDDVLCGWAFNRSPKVEPPSASIIARDDHVVVVKVFSAILNCQRSSETHHEVQRVLSITTL